MKKRARRETATAVVETIPSPAPWRRFEALVNAHARWLALSLIALASLRIADTYRTLSYTVDEPAHLACGMEWLDLHTYTLEPQHPPLARVMTAVLPRLFGSRSQKLKDLWPEGLAILSAGNRLERTLTLSRLGILPFFWLACWLAFAWTKRVAGAAAAVVAVFLLTMTPTVLAHAGLATTDMPLTAMLLLSVYHGWLWVLDPSGRRSVYFGATIGLAVITKFSALAFLPSTGVAALSLWMWLEHPAFRQLLALAARRAVPLAFALATAILTVWAAYRFSFGKSVMFSIRVPAPEFFNGIDQVRLHNASGHMTYLMGQVNTIGWPQFYAVALGVKTPLLVLALGLAGLWLLLRGKQLRDYLLPGTVLGILVFSSFFTNIRIGTRHVLPVFVVLARSGGVAVQWLLHRFDVSMARIGLALLGGALAVSSFAAHPDYLGYFNLIATSKPQAFLVDSDLDWGQDVKRLGEKLQALGASEVYFNQFAPGDLQKLYGFPAIHPLDVNGPRPGWNAVSLTALKYGIFPEGRYAYDRGFEFWPDRLAGERIGSGILLFYGPPAR